MNIVTSAADSEMLQATAPQPALPAAQPAKRAVAKALVASKPAAGARPAPLTAPATPVRKQEAVAAGEWEAF